MSLLKAVAGYTEHASSKMTPPLQPLKAPVGLRTVGESGFVGRNCKAPICFSGHVLPVSIIQTTLSSRDGSGWVWGWGRLCAGYWRQREHQVSGWDTGMGIFLTVFQGQLP